MLNAEKYRKDILKVTSENRIFAMDKDRRTIRSCIGICANCIFNRKSFSCTLSKTEWLLSEYSEPIKIRKLEYDILNHILIHTEYRYIARDHMGKIYLYTHEPSKDLNGGFWGVGEGTDENASFLKDLFRFVKWTDEEPTSIKDVLDNCEVIEDA